MSDPAVQVEDAPPSNKPGPVVNEQPLRTDEQGNPIYADWDESWSVPADEDEDDDDRADWVVEYQGGAVQPYTPDGVRAEVQTRWDDFRRQAVEHHFNQESLLYGVEKVYSTSKAAAFFGRSNQWMYWGLRNGIFTYKDGSAILPERIGKGGRRRFTLPIIREIALSCYRRGNIKEDELYEIMAKILLAEFGEAAFANAS